MRFERRGHKKRTVLKRFLRDEARVVMRGIDGLFLHLCIRDGDFGFAPAGAKVRAGAACFHIDAGAADADGGVYGLIRLLTGALGATFKKGTPAGLRIANATIGIRGTGIYMETRGTGTYFCTCWGKTEITIADTQLQKEFVEATRHNPRFIAQKPLENGSFFMPAPFETHTDGEMDILEKCVKRRAPWITEAR